MQLCAPARARFMISPDFGTVDTTFTFDASYSLDPLNDTSDLQFRWDLDGDGIWDTQWSHTKVITHQYSTSKEYNIKLNFMFI